MQVKAAIHKISQGDIKPVYLLAGEETYFARQLETALVDKVLPGLDRQSGLTVFSEEPSIPELVHAISAGGFFANNVVVVRETKLFQSQKKVMDDDRQQLQLSTCLAQIPANTYVIFMAAGKLDKRRKLFKLIEEVGVVVELTPLKARDARLHIQDQLLLLAKTMSGEALSYLLTVISFMPKIDPYWLDNELKKLALYSGQRNQITLADVKVALASVPEINVFALLDAVSQKNTQLALKLLTEQLASGESTVGFLMLIARQVRMLLLAKELSALGQAGEVAGRLKLHPFVAEKLTAQCRLFSMQQLRRALIELSAADQAVKQGRATNIFLENIIINLCRVS